MVKLLIITMLCAALAAVTHELGHYAVALVNGHKISFKLAWMPLFKLEWLKIPVGRWNMPTGITRIQAKAIATAGFDLEFITAVMINVSSDFLGSPLLSYISAVYTGVVVVHYILYPWYNADGSDFKWIVGFESDS